MDGLDLTIAGAETGLAGYRTTPPRRHRRPVWQRHSRAFFFFLLVVAPTLATATYYVFYAADQYISEAKFVVRGPTQSPGMLSSLLQTAGMSRAEDDTYAVQDFMTSRDALNELIQGAGVKDVFARPEADALARFPRPVIWHSSAIWGNSFEHFYEYYLKHVEVDLDSSTGVSSLRVRSFRAEDSQKIAQALLAAGERLVNRMNERQRENALGDARKEVGVAEARVQGVAAQISAFRNRESILDPTKQSVPMLQAISDLQQALVRTKIQLAQLISSSPRSPLIGEYQQRITVLQNQIDEAKTKVTGGGASLVPKIAEYDMLTLQREFADKALASATASLETARITAERQQLYLDQIVSPNSADYPAYPKKVASIAVVFFCLLGAYLMASLLIAGAREHKIV